MENFNGRAVASVRAGITGIVLNLILFALKLPMGLVTGSVSVISDAFNSLCDTGSSLMTVIGARMAERRPDREHPFGHGRLEYVLALIVSVCTLPVGLELMKASIIRFFHPEKAAYHPLMSLFLILSAGTKLFMFLYNRRLGRKIRSRLLLAAAWDSLCDGFATLVVLTAALTGQRTSFPADAAAGMILSLFILYSGCRAARDTVSLLLGGRPDPQLVKAIADRALEDPNILGIHDLILHDYGPGRVMASLHAEVSADVDPVVIHTWVNAAELRVEQELGVPVVIHMDPIKK